MNDAQQCAVDAIKEISDALAPYVNGATVPSAVKLDCQILGTKILYMLREMDKTDGFSDEFMSAFFKNASPTLRSVLTYGALKALSETL